MLNTAEIGLVYLTGLVQGLTLVTFPAAGSVFTSPHGYGFRSTRYGTMFLPQVLLAILTSSLSPTFGASCGQLGSNEGAMANALCVGDHLLQRWK
jgi:hypothetical protein